MNTRILITVWLAAGVVAVLGVRFALRTWFEPDWPGDVPAELAAVREPARLALGITLATLSIFAAMFVTARMRGRK
ncbi:MAG: hypothetical protein U1G05_18200 [Kiritimatiellia bacterium]